MSSGRSQSDPNIVGPFILISLGIILLLQNQGIITPIWKALWPFWPFILILSGIQLVIGFSLFGKFLTALITILVLVFIFDYSLESTSNPNFDFINTSEITKAYTPSVNDKTQDYTITIDNQDVEKDKVEAIDIAINHGAGKFTITDAQSHYLIRLDTHNASEPTFEYEIKDKIINTQIDTHNFQNKFTPSIDVSHQLNTSSSLPLSLRINTGAGASQITLNNSTLKQIIAKVGVGSLNLSLGDKSIPQETLDLDVGVGSVNLEVPKGVGYKVTYRIGLGSLITNGQRLGGSGTYRSNNYDSSEKKLLIQAQVGTGSIQITSFNPD